MTFINAALSAFTSLQPYLTGFLLHDLPGNIAAQLICATGAALFARFKSRSTNPPSAPETQGGTTPPDEPDTPHTNHINAPDDHPPCPGTPPTT